MLLKKIIVGGLLICTPLIGISAESAKTLHDVVSYSVLHNPEVNASWYTFRAAREEKRAAQGGYLPSVDLSAQAGSKRSDAPSSSVNNYGTDSVNLTLTQMLFDGFAVRNNVARLDAASLARFYELREVSEQKAQEAADAYLDVIRFQRLVDLAKENYVQHRLLFDDISERAEAGISRGVDLDQAKGRLALAETNLLTEVDNLHDVKVRFQRIVGSLPAENLQWPELPVERLPQDKERALTVAYAENPSINAAIEALNAAKAEVRQKNSPMLPRFDLRLRQELEHDRDGVDGRFDDQAVELVMSYNLYKGGTHSAEKRQFQERVNAAWEQRIQACQDVRQTVAIAYNNIASQQEQLGYLAINRESTGKARDAYREQFDIGQRTLLDLLDQENEYFQVSRSYVNAEVDLVSAQIATLAGMGSLLAALQVTGYENLAAEGLDLDGETQGDIEGRCPAEAPSRLNIDKEQLLQEVMEQAQAAYQPLTGVKSTPVVSVNDYDTGQPL